MIFVEPDIWDLYDKVFDIAMLSMGQSFYQIHEHYSIQYLK